MDARTAARLALDPAVILEAQGLRPDPWQRAYLRCEDAEIMLCCRGAGKSRTTSAKVLHAALHTPGAPFLIVTPLQRQSKELLGYVKEGYRALGKPLPLLKDNETDVEFSTNARIIALPSTEHTIRTSSPAS